MIRVLIIARRPIVLDDFGFEFDDEIEVVHFARRIESLDELADEADVVMVDVDFAEGAAFREIASTFARLPELRIVALTTSPPDHGDVARAIAAGAAGFVEVDADRGEFVEAVRAVHQGDVWLPDQATRAVLRDVAGDLAVTTSERRSRLLTVAVGLVPAAGALAAFLSLLWRKYLVHIGVRPVDLGIDPATRVVDSLASISLMIGVVGSFLYIRSWLDAAESISEESGSRWLADHRNLVGAGLGVVVFAAVAALLLFADIVLVLLIGPIVGISLLAALLGITAELPRVLRIEFARPRLAAFAAVAAVFLFVAALGAEILLSGPSFDEKGAESSLVTKFMGFRAQPTIVTDVNGDLPVRQRLYLGGNADLYVFVDPCNDDKVEMVSVGSSRLEIIDEISCSESP